MAETNALNDMVSLKPYPNVSAFLSGTKQAPTPKGYIGEPEIFPAQQELQQARAKAKEDIGKADINIEKAKREEQAAKMQVDVDVEKESAERIKEMPERMALKLKQEEASALKFMPTKDTAQDIAGLFGLVGVISMALGGGGRMSGHLALGNMNAMMEGYRKGRTDLNKREAVEFDKNFKAMQAALETLSREYKDALEIEKSDKERGRLERHVALAKSNSPVLKAMEEKLGPVRVNDFLNELQTTMDKSVTLHNNLQKAADDRQAKKDAIAAANERARQARIAADERARLSREQQLKLAEVKSSSPKALKKGEFQANYIGEIIGRPVDPDAASKAAAGTMYKMQLKELQDMNMKMGGAPGLKVSFVDYMNKYLATKAGADGKFDLSDLQAAYDNLEKNDKSFRALSDNSKLLAKKELDSVMSYLQVKYGNRAPVAEFRAAQTVLNRSNMTPTAYNNVVEAQIKDTDNRLAAAGFKPKDILALNKHFGQNRSELDLLSGVEDETDTDVSPYEFETEAEAEEFLRAVGLPEVRAKVGGQVGTVTLPTR